MSEIAERPACQRLSARGLGDEQHHEEYGCIRCLGSGIHGRSPDGSQLPFHLRRLIPTAARRIGRDGREGVTPRPSDRKDAKAVRSGSGLSFSAARRSRVQRSYALTISCARPRYLSLGCRGSPVVRQPIFVFSLLLVPQPLSPRLSYGCFSVNRGSSLL